MAESTPPPAGAEGETRHLRLGVDGWANLVVGVLTVLAIANVLPKIPW